MWKILFGESVAYFTGYAFAVSVLRSIDFKDLYFFWIFAFKLSYSVLGLISRCVAVGRVSNFFPVFLLVPFGSTFEFCSGFFPLDEVLLAFGFAEHFVESCYLVS